MKKYSSKLAPLIESYLEFRAAMGRSTCHARNLLLFDRFCCESTPIWSASNGKRYEDGFRTRLPRGAAVWKTKPPPSGCSQNIWETAHMFYRRTRYPKSRATRRISLRTKNWLPFSELQILLKTSMTHFCGKLFPCFGGSSTLAASGHGKDD